MTKNRPQGKTKTSDSVDPLFVIEELLKSGAAARYSSKGPGPNPRFHCSR